MHEFPNPPCNGVKTKKAYVDTHAKMLPTMTEKKKFFILAQFLDTPYTKTIKFPNIDIIHMLAHIPRYSGIQYEAKNPVTGTYQYISVQWPRITTAPMSTQFQNIPNIEKK